MKLIQILADIICKTLLDPDALAKSRNRQGAFTRNCGKLPYWTLVKLLLSNVKKTISASAKRAPASAIPFSRNALNVCWTSCVAGIPWISMYTSRAYGNPCLSSTGGMLQKISYLISRTSYRPGTFSGSSLNSTRILMRFLHHRINMGSVTT